MCAQACSLVKIGAFAPSASRIRTVDWEDSGATVPIVCQHCVEPVCQPACPEGAISTDARSGMVSINQDLCINCNVCRNVCPYAGPVYSSTEKQVKLCDFCGGEPACVIVCPTDALRYGNITGSAAANRLTHLGEVRKTVIKKERR